MATLPRPLKQPRTFHGWALRSHVQGQVIVEHAESGTTTSVANSVYEPGTAPPGTVVRMNVVRAGKKCVALAEAGS